MKSKTRLEPHIVPPPEYKPAEKVPLPPADARVHTTVCDYCAVGCGYKAYVWPKDGGDGEAKASKNAFDVNFPTKPLSGYWVTPNQHTTVLVDGKPHHAVVIADPNATVVNRGGNYSIRGGAIAQKCFSEDKPTRDRLKTPLLRVKGKLTPISWDDAIEIMAGVSKHILAKHGEMSWGMKTYSYQYFENTYAISKICFESIQTPAYAMHDSPAVGNATAGLSESGFEPFNASYDDFAKSDVIFISGTDPYETKTTLFTDWIYTHPYQKKGPKLIMAVTRKTPGVSYAEREGGLWLDLNPGTDTLLHIAIIRYILEKGWEDAEFIKNFVATEWEIQSGFGRGTRNTPWQWRTTWGKYGTDYEGYRKWILSYEPAELHSASAATGVSAEKIKRAAELLTGAGRKDVKASFLFEKGNYWSNNYTNTTSYAALSLTCGSGNREGRIVARLGGHQRGWASKAADYPLKMSPEKLHGRRKKELDLDRWVEAGRLRFAWVIGTTWIQAMTASQELKRRFLELTRGNKHQVKSTKPQKAIKALIKRSDSGGMIVVDQDIYLRDPIGTELADIVLPASGWGEEDFTRANGERRLRLYSKFYDPPGEAKPDWWIIARFAKKMGFEGYDWKTSNDVFEEAARFSRKKILDYYPLVWYGRKIGKKGHDILRELGTTGIQLPARYRTNSTEGKEYADYAGTYRSDAFPGIVIGTKRLHDSRTDFGTPEGPTVHPKWLRYFKTHSGKAIFHKSPWETFQDFYDAIKPSGDELWVTNGRINEIWGSGFDDQRRSSSVHRWPDNFLEIHPVDAKKRGIESGDYVEISNDNVLVQTGGFVGRRPDDFTIKSLREQGLLRRGKGSFQAVAIITEAVKPGVTFTNALWPASPANSVVSRIVDPITNQYRFKLGKGLIRKIGPSPYKDIEAGMSFVPRTLI